jgi:hypothetical protein
MELGDSMRFVLNFSAAAGASTEFGFINASNPILIGFSDVDDSEHKQQVDIVKRILSQYPSGGYDLTGHVNRVAQEIEQSADSYRTKGQKVSVIIATDSYDSKDSILDLLKPFKRLPVIITIRLCTDNEKVLDAWNEAAKIMDGMVDILDDYNEESIQVSTENPWLTYGLPLHQFRELGMGMRELNLLKLELLQPESFLRVSRLM